MKIQTEKVIAENIGQDYWLVMWPDGTVREFQSHESAEKAIKKAAKIGAADVLLTQIEWRGVPGA